MQYIDGYPAMLHALPMLVAPTVAGASSVHTAGIATERSALP